MKFKEVDVAELELGQVCYDTAGETQDKFIFCGITEQAAWFYPITKARGYGRDTDGTIDFPKIEDSWYEEV